MARSFGQIEQVSVDSAVAEGGAVHVPDAALMFGSEYHRAGSDLKLIAEDGQEFLVSDYFVTSNPASLIGPNNTVLDGQTVTVLAGPQFPGQYAQAAPAPGAASIGKIEKLAGDVTAQRADGTVHQLKVGDLVFQSDVISTGKSALIGIKLSDGTVLSLQESGQIVLNEFVYDPNGSANKAFLNVIEGTFSLFAGDVAPTGDMMIQTPVATMGIRGTTILGVNVNALAGRLSLSQDPNDHVGFVEIFNNLNGNLFTVLRTIFNKITVGENGLLSLSAKTPQELAFDLSLTQSLHDFYESLPQAGPDARPSPLTGSPFFKAPTFQDINFSAPPAIEPETLLIPSEFLIPFVESLLQDPRIQNAIIQALQETAPTAGDIDLQGLDETAEVAEGSQVDSSLPFSFGSSGAGDVGFANLDGQPVLDPSGNAVTSGGTPLEYSWDPATNTLTALAGETPIFAIIVDPADGSFTLTILGAVDHLNTDNLELDLTFTVTAANGQSVDGTLTVNILDDLPAVNLADGAAEAPVGDGTATIGDADDTDSASFAGLFTSAFGADGPKDVDQNGEDGDAITYALGVSAVDADSGLVDTLTGEAVVLNISPDGLTVTGTTATTGLTVFTITLEANTGVVTLTQERSVVHDDPNDPEETGDSAAQLSSAGLVTLTATITDGDGDSDSATAEIGLAFKFEDDGPTAVNDVAVVSENNDGGTNVGLILDISGSMRGARLQLMKDAVEELLQTGNVNAVFLVVFSGGATHVLAAEGEAWFTDIGAAIAAVDALDAGGGTNYIDALNVFTGANSSYEDPPPGGDSTFFYFLSDGVPNAQVSPELQAAWEAFLQDNGVDQAFAFGIGAGVGTNALDPIAFPNGDPDNPLVVTDESQLAETLVETLPPTQNVLEGKGADDFGADGSGGIESIVIDGVTYSFDGESISSDAPPQERQLFEGEALARFDAIQTFDDGGSPTYKTDGGTLTVETLLGGVFTFHFADGKENKAGDWDYSPPEIYGGNEYYDKGYYQSYDEGFDGNYMSYGRMMEQLPYENFRYTIFDGDGDTSTASLTLVVDPDNVDNVKQGTSRDETIESTKGDVDVLVGGLGADIFVLNDIDVADFIADYEKNEGDLVDLTAFFDGGNVDTDDVRLIDNGPGAVDALQVSDGEGFTTVALLNGDAGVNIVIDDAGTTANVSSNVIA